MYDRDAIDMRNIAPQTSSAILPRTGYIYCQDCFAWEEVAQLDKRATADAGVTINIEPTLVWRCQPLSGNVLLMCVGTRYFWCLLQLYAYLRVYCTRICTYIVRVYSG